VAQYQFEQLQLIRLLAGLDGMVFEWKSKQKMCFAKIGNELQIEALPNKVSSIFLRFL
jgi:hypothetical protein